MRGGTDRRSFLTAGAAAAALAAVAPTGRAWSAEPAGLEHLHRPVLRLPTTTTNGAKVPVVVAVPLPFAADHYITDLEVVNERDPVPSKGVFSFTPANGQAYLAFQVRLDEGVSTVTATVACNRHGRWSSARTIEIPPGGGGCAGAAPRAAAMDEVLPPVIRIPRLVADGAIVRDEVIEVQLKTKHPNRTGLAVRDGKFVQAGEPFYLSELAVFDGDERVSRFTMTSALSDNPLITFKLRVRREGPLRIVLTNNRGQRFEAVHQIRFA